MLKTFAAAAVVAALAAGPAFAAGGVKATLEKSIGSPQSKIFDGAVVRCDGNTCQSTSDLASSSPKSICRAIYKAYGRVTAFAGPSGPFAADALAACNK